MTAQQISKELRDRADQQRIHSHLIEWQWLLQMADSVDVLAKPQPVSQSIQESAQRAALELWPNGQPNVSYCWDDERRNELEKQNYRDTKVAIILSHLAPHCVVNQEIIESFYNVAKNAVAYVGAANYAERQSEAMGWLCDAKIAAEAVQSQEKGTK